jgi:hypothetical protein
MLQQPHFLQPQWRKFNEVQYQCGMLFHAFVGINLTHKKITIRGKNLKIEFTPPSSASKQLTGRTSLSSLIGASAVRSGITRPAT